MAVDLKTAEEFRTEFNHTGVMSFTNSMDWDKQEVLEKLRKKKKDRYDYEPILEYYGLS